MRGLIASVLMLAGAYTATARIHDGMLFRSYDVPADQRTSMVISGAQGDCISFSDSISFSFSLRLEPNKAKFGYVSRIQVDELLPIDMIMSPEGDKPQLFITADHSSVVPLGWVGESIEEWNDIYLNLVAKGDSLVLNINGRRVFSIPSRQGRHRAKAYFGKTDSPGPVTSDVAPMMLADLSVRVDNGKHATWRLSSESDMGSKRGISVVSSNEVFLQDMNRKWTKTWSTALPSPGNICILRDNSFVYFVADGTIAEIEVSSARSTMRPYRTDMCMPKVAGEFVASENGEVLYADMESGRIIRYDSQRGDWDSPNSKSRRSVHLHHNTVYLGSSVVQLFGYGQHRYSKEMYIWDLADRSVIRVALDNVSPRYLSAAGVKDGKIYVLGGKGNSAGLQTLGTQLYQEMLEIDPEGLSVKSLWTSDLLKNNVPAHDLVFEKDSNSVLALVFNPEINDSGLQLTRFDLETGESQPLADPIPFRFNDITSSARLIYNEEYDFLLAAVAYTDENGLNQAEIHILGCPVLDPIVERTSRSTWLWLLLLAASVFAAAAVLYIRKRAGVKADFVRYYSDLQTTVPEADVNSPGIHLLGGFRVVDAAGTDITSSFSPTLIQLLLILVLYTEEKGGVSNMMLKSLLWSDKSDEQFNNNKGVNIKKLRTLLSNVGDISIVVEGGVWSVKVEPSLCDYSAAMAALKGTDDSEVIRAVLGGSLLPEYNYDWLDPFKSHYEDIVLSRLNLISTHSVSPQMMVRISDARLKFDALDESAIRQKCKALYTMGKAASAKTVYKRFQDDYLSSMDEEFNVEFTDFLSD